MRTIMKYPVLPGFPTKMPKGAELLSVHGQGFKREVIHVFAIVETDNPIVERDISIYSSKRPVDDKRACKATYIGSARELMENIVYHCFDHGEL